MDAQAVQSTLDEVIEKHAGLRITFKPKAIKHVRALRELVGKGISMSPVDAKFLNMLSGSDTTDDWVIVIGFTDDFPKSRERFEKEVLPGIAMLEIAA